MLVVVASIASAIWSVIDRRRPHYEHLARRLRTAARYYLCFVMLNYGVIKILQLQFPFPSELALVREFGDRSPMGVLWSFMGYSTPYNVFTGGAEVVGGLLLLGRRTTTLGALVIIGVMSNVVMLNFCYDVPVKIFSVHLLVAATCMAARDLRRLANLLVLNRATAPRDLGPARSRRMFAAKLAVVASIVLANLYGGWDQSRRYGGSKPPLAGVWEVSSMRRNGVELPALGPDEHRWRRIVVSRWGAIVEIVDESRSAWHETSFDATTSTLTLGGGGQLQPWVLHATRDGDELRLDGFYDLAPVEITLEKRKFLLETRGFHWVNDYPYNR